MPSLRVNQKLEALKHQPPMKLDNNIGEAAPVLSYRDKKLTGDDRYRFISERLNSSNWSIWCRIGRGIFPGKRTRYPEHGGSLWKASVSWLGLLLLSPSSYKDLKEKTVAKYKKTLLQTIYHDGPTEATDNLRKACKKVQKNQAPQARGKELGDCKKEIQKLNYELDRLNIVADSYKKSGALAKKSMRLNKAGFLALRKAMFAQDLYDSITTSVDSIKAAAGDDGDDQQQVVLAIVKIDHIIRDVVEQQKIIVVKDPGGEFETGADLRYPNIISDLEKAFSEGRLTSFEAVIEMVKNLAFKQIFLTNRELVKVANFKSPEIQSYLSKMEEIEQKFAAIAVETLESLFNGKDADYGDKASFQDFLNDVKETYSGITRDTLNRMQDFQSSLGLVSVYKARKAASTKRAIKEVWDKNGSTAVTWGALGGLIAFGTQNLGYPLYKIVASAAPKGTASFPYQGIVSMGVGFLGAGLVFAKGLLCEDEEFPF